MSSEETIDPSEYITREQAAAICPGRPHKGAVWRWMVNGTKCGDGFVHLKHVRAGSRIYTTRTWLREFLDACAAGRQRSHVPAVRHSRSPSITERQRQIDDAKRELANS